MTNAQSLLNNVYLFKDLTPQELEMVNEIGRLETYSPGDEIFSEGDSAHALYVIKYGTVKIQHNGKEDLINVATLGTGSHFGEMAFVDKEKRSATVTATERCEIARIEYEDLDKVLAAQPAMAVKIFRAMAVFLCGRLRVTTTDLSFAREKNLRHF